MAHKYILGASGSGKSTLLKQLIIDDIKAGKAVFFFDPHGHDTDDLLGHIPQKRIKDTVLFDPSDLDNYIVWNCLEGDNVPLLADSMTNAIRSAWGMTDISTPNVSMFVEALIYTARQLKLTFYDCLFILYDHDIEDMKNPVLQLFWDTYYSKTQKDKDNLNASTVNKLFTLLLDPRMQKLFNSKTGKFSVFDAVKDKIVFIRLPQGQIGIEKVKLLGSMLLAQVHLASLSRPTDVPLAIYIDEVHTFAWSTIAEMLSGLRKFNVEIIVSHQYIKQLEPRLFASLMGNCDTRLIFRVSPKDASEFQECLKNGPICLEDLEPYRYRAFPWSPQNRDKTVEPLPAPLSNKRAERVRKYTIQNYCREY